MDGCLSYEAEFEGQDNPSASIRVIRVIRDSDNHAGLRYPHSNGQEIILFCEKYIRKTEN